MRYQNRSRHCAFVRDGETYQQHVYNVQYLNRRLYEIECEPVARPYSDFAHPNDVYLVNADLYRENRVATQRRLFARARPYYDELRRVAGTIAERRRLDRGGLAAAVPKFKAFYWTPAPADSPLDYGCRLGEALTHAERQNLRRIERGLQRAASAAPAPGGAGQGRTCPRCQRQLRSGRGEDMRLTVSAQRPASARPAGPGEEAGDGRVVRARKFVDRRPFRQDPLAGAE